LDQEEERDHVNGLYK